MYEHGVHVTLTTTTVVNDECHMTATMESEWGITHTWPLGAVFFDDEGRTAHPSGGCISGHRTGNDARSYPKRETMLASTDTACWRRRSPANTHEVHTTVVVARDFVDVGHRQALNFTRIGAFLAIYQEKPAHTSEIGSGSGYAVIEVSSDLQYRIVASLIELEREELYTVPLLVLVWKRLKCVADHPATTLALHWKKFFFARRVTLNSGTKPLRVVESSWS